MSKRREARELGMNRSITRRQFINGVAVGVSGASLLAAEAGAAGAPQSPPAYYPPALTGLRGSHDGSFEVAHQVRDGDYESFPRLDVDTGEEYDLVVVGGGLSGLSAAYFFQKVYGEDKKVLILDNHDDFGGHAKRNEFEHEGRVFIGYGGTMGISTPFPYSYVARALIDDLGVRVERFSEYLDDDIYSGLESAMFFDRETFGEDRLVESMPGRRGGEPARWRKFLSKAPLSDAARRDLARLFENRRDKDYMSGRSPSEKEERLARMSYQDYLIKKMGMTPEAMPFLRYMGFRNNKKIDTCPALEAARGGSPGFAGLGIAEPPRLDWSRYYFHYPDGNASIARLLVAKLVPRALPSGMTMESIVPARLDYERLDEPASDDRSVRIRLNATVVRLVHEGPVDQADWIRLAYVSGGKVHGVRARNSVLACYNSVIRFLVPELPDAQKQALIGEGAAFVHERLHPQLESVPRSGREPHPLSRDVSRLVQPRSAGLDWRLRVLSRTRRARDLALEPESDDARPHASPRAAQTWYARNAHDFVRRDGAFDSRPARAQPRGRRIRSG